MRPERVNISGAMDQEFAEAALHCDGAALTSVFSVLGKRWTGLVIGVLLERPARFAEIARAIPGITESMLSARLTELKDAGLVTREVIEGPPIASLYGLTPSGEALRPALMALGEWAQVHMGSQVNMRSKV
jgi:DNA-binding HxlR family transcriptional regulator